MKTPLKRIADFEKMAFGIFVHWGVYSLYEQGEWTMLLHKINKEEYSKKAEEFIVEDYNPKNFVKIVKQSGAKYITITTKHHDGFFLYNSNEVSNYNSLNIGAKKDLLKQLVDACNEYNIKIIFYHATYDWYNEDFDKDFNKYLEYLKKSVEILCKNYGEIGGFWFDGNWSKPNADWKLDELYGLIRKYQPNAMIINNTGLDNLGTLVHKEIDSVTYEQGLPNIKDDDNSEKYVSAEMCHTMNNHWGIAKNDFKYKSTTDLIETLCYCRKVGANYLLNVSPDKNFNLPKIQEGILEIIGGWLDMFGEPIYNGKPCEIKSFGKDFALKTDKDKIYLFIHNLSISGDENVTTNLVGNNPRTFINFKYKINGIKWLDNNENLVFTFNEDEGLLTIKPTSYNYGTDFVVRVAEVY